MDCLGFELRGAPSGSQVAIHHSQQIDEGGAIIGFAQPPCQSYERGVIRYTRTCPDLASDPRENLSGVLQMPSRRLICAENVPAAPQPSKAKLEFVESTAATAEAAMRERRECLNEYVKAQQDRSIWIRGASLLRKVKLIRGRFAALDAQETSFRNTLTTQPPIIQNFWRNSRAGWKNGAGNGCARRSANSGNQRECSSLNTRNLELRREVYGQLLNRKHTDLAGAGLPAPSQLCRIVDVARASPHSIAQHSDVRKIALTFLLGLMAGVRFSSFCGSG